MNIQSKRANSILLVALIAIAVILGGWLLVRQVQRFTDPGEAIWVARAGLGPGQKVTSGDLRLARFQDEELPAGAITDRQEIEGRQLVRRKAEGSPFTREDFSSGETVAAPGHTAAELPEGRVLTSMRVQLDTLPLNQIRQGDRVDLVYMDDSGAGASLARVAVRDVILWGRRLPPPPPEREEARGPFGIDLSPPGARDRPQLATLYLAIRPEDMLAYTEATAAGGIRFALRSKADLESGFLTDIEASRGPVIEVIDGAETRLVAVAR